MHTTKWMKVVVAVFLWTVVSVLSAPAFELTGVQVPDALRPRAGEWGGLKAVFIPLPQGGEMFVVNEGGDQTKGLQKEFQIVAKMPCISGLKSLIPPENRIEIPLFGQTFFGVKHDDIEPQMVLYEGGVVVKGMYTIVVIGIPKGRALDNSILNILSQFSLRLPADNFIDKLLALVAQQEQPAMRIAGLRFAMNMSPESAELVQALLKASREGGNTAVAEWCESALVELNPAVYGNKMRRDAPNCTAVVNWLDLKPGLQVASTLRLPKVEGVPDQVADDGDKKTGGIAENRGGADTPKQTAQTPQTPPVPEGNGFAPANLPRFKLPTLAEADEGIRKLKRTNRRRFTPNRTRAQTVKPILADDFVNATTRKAAIAQLRAGLQSLLGPFSEEDQKKFDKKWNAVSEYPCDAILEWLKAASPIVTSMLMLKSELGALANDYENAMHEADIARNLRNYEACDDWMQEVGRIASEMKGVQAGLADEADKLAALGEMPDPAEQKAEHARRRKAARETVREYFGGTPSEDTRQDIDGEYVTDGYVTFTTGGSSLHFGNAIGFGRFGFPGNKVYLHPVAEFEEDGEKGVGLLLARPSSPMRYVGGKRPTEKELEEKAYDSGEGLFVVPGKDGGYILYSHDPLLKVIDRTVIAHDFDEDKKPALRVTHCRINLRNGEIDQAAAIFRHTDRQFKKLPEMSGMRVKTVANDRSEELYRKRMEMSFREEFKKVLAIRDQFEKMAEAAELKDLPLSFELRYVLDRVECPDGKKVDLMEWVEKEYKTDWLGNEYHKHVNEVADAEAKKCSSRGDGASLRSSIRYSYKKQFQLYERAFDPFGFTQRCQFELGFIPKWHPGKDNHGYTVWKKGAREILDRPEDIMRIRWQPPLIVRVDDPKHQPKDYKSPIEIPVWIEPDRMCKHPNREYKDGRFEVRCDISTRRSGRTAIDLFKGNCSTNEKRKVVVNIQMLGWGMKPEIEVRLRFPDLIASTRTQGDKIWPSVTFHYKLETLKGRHLKDRMEELAAKFSRPDTAEAPPKNPEEMSEQEVEAEAVKERIAFHKENIRFCEKTIAGLKKELDEEQDPVRRRSLEYSIMLEESNIIYENDRIRAEQTGEFTASRTPFDDFCKVQFLQNIQKEIEEIKTLERARKRVDFLIDKMPPGEQRTALNLMLKLHEESPEDLDKWRKLGDAMGKKYTGRLTYEQGMAESELADREEALRRVELLKKGCDYLMIMGGGELPAAISKIYSLSTSVLEEGWSAGVKTAITSWSPTIDYLWAAYDGYESGGLLGMAQGIGMNYVMGEIVPSMVEKAKGIEIKLPWKKTPKPKTGAALNKNIFADLNAMEFEMGKAKQEVDSFVEAYQKYDAAKKSGASKEQLAKLEADLVKPIAIINANPTAKALMKYTEVGGQGPEFSKAMQAGFDSQLQGIHTKVMERFHALQYEKGYNRQEIVPIRNETSKGTVGMDADFGLVEQPSIRVMEDGSLAPNMWMRQNYERTTKQKWMVDAQASWNKAYAEVTGGYSAKKSWENITTSIHPEAYRDMSILKADPKKGNMAEIMEGISLSNAQQIMDVTRFKSDEMLATKDFPRLVGVRESCRGTAKDMGTKLLPAIDAKIKPLKELELKLTKTGEALMPDAARELRRLEAARDHYKKVYDTFDKIGKGKIPPKDWDDEIYTTTGGMGINSCLNDMSDLFKSLFFSK